MATGPVNLRDLQAPIKARYLEHPEEAVIECVARSAGSDLSDPLHCEVTLDSAPGLSIRSGPTLDGQLGLSRAVAMAQAELDMRETAFGAYLTLSQAPALAQVGLDQAELAQRQAGKAQEGWQADWTPAVLALGLPGDCSVDDAEAAVAAWAVIETQAPHWRTDQLRVAQMTCAIDDFEREVTEVASAGFTRPADEPALTTAATVPNW